VGVRSVRDLKRREPELLKWWKWKGRRLQ